MENLQEQLTISDAMIEDWTHRKTEKDGLKLHFTVSAPLPKLLAEQLKCSGIYDIDTGRIDLLHRLKDTELLINGEGDDPGASFFPDVIYKFKASRDEDQFTVQFSVHISGRCDEMHEILKHAPDYVSLTVRPRQGQLFEGGTRVDVTPTSELISRVATNLSADEQKSADEILAGVNEQPDEVPLAAAATMGGTHQRRKLRADKRTVN